jgi:hypothetical protein
MAIMAIIGELGKGKTLSLTYLLWRNFYYKRRVIYANYTLYNIPYYKITTVSQLGRIYNGYLGADEMWIWLETGAGESLKRKIIRDILRRSRKRNLTIAFTTQTLDQVPPRIRKILDYIAVPILSKNATKCMLLIFAGPSGKVLLKRHFFNTGPIMQCYNTNEEIEDLVDDVTGTGSKSDIISSLKLKPIGKKIEDDVSKFSIQSLNNQNLTLQNITLPRNLLNQTPIFNLNPISVNPIVIKDEQNISIEDATSGAFGFEEVEDLENSKE